MTGVGGWGVNQDGVAMPREAATKSYLPSQALEPVKGLLGLVPAKQLAQI